MYVLTFLYMAAAISGAFATCDYNLNGTTALVTGGAKGIGYEIVRYFLKYGVRTVYIVDINKTRGEEAERKFNKKYGPGSVVFIYADVTKDLDRVAKMFKGMDHKFDILVNNAAILDEYDPEKTVLTNTLAPIMWSRRCFELMRKDKGGKGGTIINIVSVSGYVRDPFYAYYKASQYGLLGFTYCFGHKYNYLNYGVRMFGICPGLTYTDMTKQQMVIDEQVEIYKKFIAEDEWQEPCVVGKATALLYRTAESGTAFTIRGGNPPIVAHDRYDVTVEYLLSLE